MKNLKRNVKGITLIALVISIIVLLILAGVSIGMITEENGLLSQAQKAKEHTERATEEEQRQIAKFNAVMNKETYNYTTEDGEIVPIPAGFAPTQIDGEDSVNEGLVIIDEEGNEFVWVPVNISNFQVAEGYWNGEKGEILSKCTEPYSEGYTTENAEYEAMIKSIKNNGGFYIGRYETGNEGGNAIVKKNATVYNQIGWNASEENAMNDETGGAVEKSKEFKNRKSI